ncbi:MAG: hypothetical protein J7L73_07155 [Anaerolineales bacterium]|nr:hypothetical protein [Anaerolineales bacterium]
MKSLNITRIVGMLFVVALVGLLFVFPSAAYADSGGGSGTLKAQGDGLAGVRGNGEITITGNGVLWFKDHAGDAQLAITGNGVRRVLPGGWVRYTGFSGELHVIGSGVTVALSGYDIDLTAEGTGRFVLCGNGHYQTGYSSGDWSRGFQIMSYP